MFERNQHEVLTVESVPRRDGSGSDHIVKRHYTMYTHSALSVPTTIAIGSSVVVSLSLVRWDDQSLITDGDRTVDIYVNGSKVASVTTVLGQASVTLQFADPGSYLVQATHPLTQGAEAEVTVA